MIQKLKYVLGIFFITNFFLLVTFKVYAKRNINYLNYEKKIESNQTNHLPITNNKIELQSNISNVSSDDITINNYSKPLRIPISMVLPFVLLLLMIATGPLFYQNFWHKNYKNIAISLAIFVVAFYLFYLNNVLQVLEIILDYIQFISLISALYIVSGGIYVKIDAKPSPFLNTFILLFGAIISNFIGTTGASMLLIRPYMRINKSNLSIYHIVFFIIIVSNVGGALTPIGDPPLFLGFLKGVPFFWTLFNNIKAWSLTIIILLTMFLILNLINKKPDKKNSYKKLKISISGISNIIILFIIISLVFFDPNIFSWVPCISYHGHKFSFVRETLLILISILSYKNTSKEIITKNKFSFDPLNEVIFIFIGIFGTMTPAMEIVSFYSKSDIGKFLTQPNYLYWTSGFLSSFLDNAPTYLNFLAASMGSDGANISNIHQVKSYSEGLIYPGSILKLKAISLGSVFFGAMTYIGNGPNFMVKAIAEDEGVKMPSFFGYLFKYSMIFLLPTLFIVWFLFFKTKIF